MSLAPIWPQFWLGQWLHVGSAASFGLGQYRLVGLDHRFGQHPSLHRYQLWQAAPL